MTTLICALALILCIVAVLLAYTIPVPKPPILRERFGWEEPTWIVTEVKPICRRVKDAEVDGGK